MMKHHNFNKYMKKLYSIERFLRTTEISEKCDHPFPTSASMPISGIEYRYEKIELWRKGNFFFFNYWKIKYSSTYDNTPVTCLSKRDGNLRNKSLRVTNLSRRVGIKLTKRITVR